jgi:activator of Hsp90 ATPase protein 1
MVISKPSTPAPTVQGQPHKISTSELSEDVEFTATAQDLYSCFVEPEKLTRWTRNQVSVEPKVGGEFSLFQGNISGKFLSLEPGKEIEQTWRLSSWPEGALPRGTRLTTGHYCNLKMVFDQGINTTTLRLHWSGVPVSEEDIILKKFNQFYVQEIK